MHELPINVAEVLSHPALSGSSANFESAEALLDYAESCHTLLFRVLLQMDITRELQTITVTMRLSHPALSGSSANPTDAANITDGDMLSHPALSGSSANLSAVTSHTPAS